MVVFSSLRSVPSGCLSKRSLPALCLQLSGLSFFRFLLCSVALSFAPFPEAGAGAYVEVGPQKPSSYTQFISHGDVLRHFHFGSCSIFQWLNSKRMSYPLRILAYFFHWKNQYDSPTIRQFIEVSFCPRCNQAGLMQP